MPRKPNYKFERMERERAKAKKKAERKLAREERKKAQAGEGPAVEGADDADSEPVAAARPAGDQG